MIDNFLKALWLSVKPKLEKKHTLFSFQIFWSFDGTNNASRKTNKYEFHYSTDHSRLVKISGPSYSVNCDKHLTKIKISLVDEIYFRCTSTPINSTYRKFWSSILVIKMYLFNLSRSREHNLLRWNKHFWRLEASTHSLDQIEQGLLTANGSSFRSKFYYCFFVRSLSLLYIPNFHRNLIESHLVMISEGH